MKTEIDEQRLVVEENKSAQDALTRQLESKKMKQDHLNEIKKAEQELDEALALSDDPVQVKLTQ